MAKKKPSLLTPQHLVEYRKERLKSVAKNTVRPDLSLISVLFKVAKDECGMPYLANPVSLRKLSTSKGRDRRLSDDEAARFERELHKCRNVWFGSWSPLPFTLLHGKEKAFVSSAGT